MTVLNRIPRRHLLRAFESLRRFTFEAAALTAAAIATAAACYVGVKGLVWALDAACVALLAWMGVI